MGKIPTQLPETRRGHLSDGLYSEEEEGGFDGFMLKPFNSPLIRRSPSSWISIRYG